MSLIGNEPNYGDLIEFLRFGYDHWGVYVGDSYVVHLTAGDGHSSVSAGLGNIGLSSGIGERAVVKKELLTVVAKGCSYRVNNQFDKKTKPRPPRKIVMEALGEVGKEKFYHLTLSNCEHFATKMRYGYGFCKQVFEVGKSLLLGSLYGVLGAVLLVPPIGVFLGITTFAVTYKTSRSTGRSI